MERIGPACPEKWGLRQKYASRRSSRILRLSLLRRLDYFFGGFFGVGALLHAAGSITAYGDRPDTLLWALSATLAGLLLSGLNLMRAGRPGHRSLAALCLFGALARIAIDVSFGNLIGNIFDPRVLLQGVTAGALAAFSVNSLQTPKRLSA
jgi:hypothetical protein